MLVAAAALLLQFSVFSPRQIQPTEKVGEPAGVTKVLQDPVLSNKPQRSASSGGEVLSAERLSSNAEASAAFAPGRLVAEPVAVSSAPADPVASPAAIEPAPIVPFYGVPIKAVSDQRQKREWLALSIAAHSAAGFDAWSTRRVLSSVPQAQEMNPLLRPFAGNASMYAAVQVAPTILDFVSRRMMNSRYSWARHAWWLPQAVSAAISLSSGVHNLGVYNSR
jgi:hypothetical protein